MFESNLYLIFIYALGILFVVAAVSVLYWCAKNGQLRNLEKGAMVVFTDDEPAGVHRDVFPGKSGEKALHRLQEREKRSVTTRSEK